MRSASRFPSVLMVAFLPLLAPVRADAAEAPRGSAPHLTAALVDGERRQPAVLRPAERPAELNRHRQPRSWPAASREVSVQRSRRPFGALSRLLGRTDSQPAGAVVLQPAAEPRWQQKGRLP